MGPMRPIRCNDATAENGFKAFGDVGDFAKVKSVGLVKLFHHLRVVCVQVLLHPRRVCVHPPVLFSPMIEIGEERRSVVMCDDVITRVVFIDHCL